MMNDIRAVGAYEDVGHSPTDFYDYARQRWADLIRHGAAPEAQQRATFPKGKATHCIASVASRYKNVPPRAAHLNICPKGANISHARSAYFTAPQARFHTAATLPYFTLRGQSRAALSPGAALRRAAPDHGRRHRSVQNMYVPPRQAPYRRGSGLGSIAYLSLN